MHKLLLVSWARSVVRMLRCTSCCRCLGLEAGVRMLRCRSCCRCRGLEAASECFDVQVAAGILGSKQGRNAKMYDLLPVSWARSGVRMLRCAISCRCLGLEAGSECQDVRFVAGVLGSSRAKMYDLLQVSWARSGVRMRRCTICWQCLGLEAGVRMLR